MFNNLSKLYLTFHDEKLGLNLIQLARSNNFQSLGIILAEYMEKQFTYSIEIKEEYGILLHNNNLHDKAYLIYSKILNTRCLTEEISKRIIYNQHLSIKNIEDSYIYYNEKLVHKISENQKKDFPLITLTITSCKRLDLFTKTLNSFINCCTDIDKIDKWFCVDDNSSEEDRSIMVKLYPFIVFYFKKLNEKGHPQSMNIIRNNVKTPYIFHMEDDWKFFDKRNYISECLEVLGQDRQIGQCLINKNYGEVPDNVNLIGGYFHTTPTGLRYYKHETCNTEEEYVNFYKKYGNGFNSAYWPHFSFRPSLLRRNILTRLGEFNEKVSHFEREYAERYNSKGYISAFLESIYCIHTGRLTTEQNDPSKINAYVLNNEAQFSGKEDILDNTNRMKIYVVNLDKRSDRWNTFVEKSSLYPQFNFIRYSAINGWNLKNTCQLQQIFDNNDYNMRRGMVGCAMSHLKLYIELLEDDDNDIYCILEDDIDFVPEFDKKLDSCIELLKNTDWDMFYLGHHVWKKYIDKNTYSKTLWPQIEKKNRKESIDFSIGGTIGYIITKKGAELVLNYINETGMTNGIDTVLQKAADTINVYYVYPHLIYSECYRGTDMPDSDIQFNFDTISVSFEERLEEELKYYDNIKEIKGIMTKCPDNLDIPIYWKYNNTKDLNKVINNCKYPYYTINNSILFITPKDMGKYYHRFKKYGKWCINDAIQY